MNDDATTAGAAPPDADDEIRDDDPLDKHDDAVLAADATGMLAGERLITQAEIEEGLEGDSPRAGDV